MLEGNERSRPAEEHRHSHLGVGQGDVGTVADVALEATQRGNSGLVCERNVGVNRGVGAALEGQAVVGPAEHVQQLALADAPIASQPKGQNVGPHQGHVPPGIEPAIVPNVQPCSGPVNSSGGRGGGHPVDKHRPTPGARGRAGCPAADCAPAGGRRPLAQTHSFRLCRWGRMNRSVPWTTSCCSNAAPSASFALRQRPNAIPVSTSAWPFPPAGPIEDRRGRWFGVPTKGCGPPGVPGPSRPAQKRVGQIRRNRVFPDDVLVVHDVADAHFGGVLQSRLGVHCPVVHLVEIGPEGVVQSGLDLVQGEHQGGCFCGGERGVVLRHRRVFCVAWMLGGFLSLCPSNT